MKPFLIDDMDKLVSLSSGPSATKSIGTDVFIAEKATKDAKETFIEDWLEKNVNFFELVERLNVKRLGYM